MNEPTVLNAFFYWLGVFVSAVTFLLVLFGMVVGTIHQLKRRRIRRVWSPR